MCGGSISYTVWEPKFSAGPDALTGQDKEKQRFTSAFHVSSTLTWLLTTGTRRGAKFGDITLNVTQLWDIRRDYAARLMSKKKENIRGQSKNVGVNYLKKRKTLLIGKKRRKTY